MNKGIFKTGGKVHVSCVPNMLGKQKGAAEGLIRRVRESNAR